MDKTAASCTVGGNVSLDTVTKENSIEISLKSRNKNYHMTQHMVTSAMKLKDTHSLEGKLWHN